MYRQPRRISAVDEQFAQGAAEGFGEAHVHDETVAEEAGRAVPCMVVQLIRDDEIPRAYAFLKTAHRTDRQDPLHAQRFQREDVRPHVDFGRPGAVAAAVTCQESHAPALEGAGHDCVAGIAEGGGGPDLLEIRQAFHTVEPRAADDRDLRVRHFATPLVDSNGSFTPMKPDEMVLE